LMCWMGWDGIGCPIRNCSNHAQTLIAKCIAKGMDSGEFELARIRYL
jgi:hypothetical protein